MDGWGWTEWINEDEWITVNTWGMDEWVNECGWMNGWMRMIRMDRLLNEWIIEDDGWMDGWIN